MRMKRRRSSGKFILAVSLLIVLGVLTVAYATLSTVLKIEGSGTIQKDTDIVKFVNPHNGSGDYTICYTSNNTVANIHLMHNFTKAEDSVVIQNIEFKNVSTVNAKLKTVKLYFNNKEENFVESASQYVEDPLLAFKNEFIKIEYDGPEEGYILNQESQYWISSLTITCLKVPTDSDYDFDFSISMEWGEYADSSDSSSDGNLSSDSSSDGNLSSDSSSM